MPDVYRDTVAEGRVVAQTDLALLSTGRFNRRHKLFGHLFSGRYKALIVDAAAAGN